MGGGKKQTIGFQYLMGLHMVICKGPINALLEIGAGDRSAWKGNATSSQLIFIARPELFGGTAREGGIMGYLALMFGEDTQAPNPYLLAQLGPRQPAYRGVFSAVFQKGMVAAMNPYLKPWAYRVRRTTAGWEGGTAWYPAKAEVDVGGGIKCANVAHVVYEILTNTEDGMGYPPSRIDEASFKASADLFFAEALGVWVKWMQSESIEQTISNIIDHANCLVIEDPETRLFRMVPMRGDYDVNTLLHFGPRTGPDATNPSTVYDVGCVLESFERTSPDEIVNEVTVKWKNSRDNQDDSITIQNPAALQAAGGIINQTKTYAGCPTKAIGARLCQRDLDVLSAPLARVRLRCNRKAANLYAGKVIKLSWPDRGIANLPIRILRVSKGNIDGGEITIEGTEDVYTFGAATYVVPQTSGWVAPDPTPQPSPAIDAFEIPFRDIVQVIGIDAAKAKDPTAGFAGLVSKKPVGSTSYGVQLFEKTGSTAYTDAGTGDFTPTGITVDAIPAELGPTTMSLANTVGLEQLSVGEVGFLGDHPNAEAVLIKGISGAVLTIGRGCLDTTPKAWPAGSRFWGYDNYGAASQTEYATGETVSLKALTNAAGGTLDIALAPIDTVAMNRRLARPYPPGNLKINGVAYPPTVASGLVISWAHRSRLLQADTVTEASAGNIGPEAGTTYTVRAYLAGVLKSTNTGITATTFTPASPGTGLVRIEVDAVRDTFTSWQTAAVEFKFGAPIIDTPFMTFVAGVPSSAKLRWRFGAPPFTVTATGLPSGVTVAADGTVSYDGTTGQIATAPATFTVTDHVSTSGVASVPMTISGQRSKWRLWITANGGSYARAIEVEMRAGGTNRAAGGTPFATNAFSGQPASGAFDGLVDDITSHRWTSANGGVPVALGYLMPAAYNIDEITIVGEANDLLNQTIRSFTVQSSIDSTTGLDGTWVNEWEVKDQTTWPRLVARHFPRYVPDFDPMTDAFGAAERGIWLDASDLGSMFQDVAGTTPVTAAGQRVALWKDKSGNGQHVSQATLGNRPTLRYDGTHYYLEFVASATQWLERDATNTLYPGTLSLWMAAAVMGSTLGGGTIISRSIAASAIGRWNLYAGTNVAGSGIYQWTSSNTDAKITLPTPIEKAVVSGYADRVSGKHRMRYLPTSGVLNQAEAALDANATNLNQAYRLRIGAYGAAGDTALSGSTFEGRIYGILVRIAGPLDFDQAMRAEAWLKDRHGTGFAD